MIEKPFILYILIPDTLDNAVILFVIEYFPWEIRENKRPVIELSGIQSVLNR